MIRGYAISTHLIKDRMDRLEKISTTIGFGDIKYKVACEKRHCIFGITDTGLLCVLNEADNLIVTMYPLSISKAKATFGDHIPDELYRVLRKNLKKGYIKE